MNAVQKTHEDGTIELTITIAWKDIVSVYERIKSAALSVVELPGFRKGKAPTALAEKELNKTKLYEEVIKEVVPKAYSDTVSELKLRPIIYPKIELAQAEEGKDWVIKATTCQRPTVTLGDYKTAVKDLKTSKLKKIWLPGEEKKSPEEQKPQKPSVDEILRAVYNTVTANLPALLLEQEVNRSLSGLIDQTKKLGLTVEQYLSSTNRTSESVRAEYEAEAKKTLTMEFALEEIADTEGILVGDDDIETVIKTAKTDDERRALEHDRYYLATILRRQKTLDFLVNLY